MWKLNMHLVAAEHRYVTLLLLVVVKGAHENYKFKIYNYVLRVLPGY